MRVDELMTREVVTDAPEAPLKEVAALLVEHRISGVPVCDPQGKVLGVVSERDILFKELGREERGGGPLAWFAAWPAAAAAKANARTAGDTMSSPALTIGPSRRIGAAARLMVERDMNRLPVVDRDGALVGIVTRADLVRAFARGDDEIRREIEEDVLARSLWLAQGTVSVDVEVRSIAEILTQLVARVPGVVAVRSQVAWRDDDVRSRRGILASRAR